MVEDNVILCRRDCCAVCGNEDLHVALDLPSLPLTDTFTRSAAPVYVPTPDLKLLLCRSCGHGQLQAQVAPEILYGNEYHFRTGASAVARSGTAFFVDNLRRVAPSKRFRHVLDIGCNDLYLLRQLSDDCELRTGIDPLWIGREDQAEEGIRVIGATVEDIDLTSVLECPPDLIVCRHTLEHIWDPRRVLEQLLEVASEETLFLFEVPSLDPLLARFRIDQVFHQHLQYFSVHSICKLISDVGAQYLSHAVNFHDWGAMVVAFRKGGLTPTDASSDAGMCTVEAFESVREVFQQQMVAASRTLHLLAEPKVYGYGAAQMLPVLAYHLGTDLSMLSAVLDDDPSKDGLRYSNLPLEVRSAGEAGDLQDSAVLITAVDNVKPIMEKLLSKRPKCILYPLSVI